MGFRMILDLESLDASVPSRRHFLSSEERKFVQSGTHDLCGLFAGQGCDNEFSDILAKPALSIEQTHFQGLCQCSAGKISIQKKTRAEPERARHMRECTRFPPTIRMERRRWTESKPLPVLSGYSIK